MTVVYIVPSEIRAHAANIIRRYGVDVTRQFVGAYVTHHRVARRGSPDYHPTINAIVGAIRTARVDITWPRIDPE